jgi:lipopolysaccharide transport system ATP-binding protein
MPPIIKITNLSKQYRLGQVGTGTLRNDFQRWWCRIRGKEDPFLKIGEANVRTIKGDSEYVWALKDINLEVNQGEILGIIGKNGAGKSTLLKILSRVTGPTTGRIDYNGRIGSLLEVGTGFHPELTGRDNIFLNGAILGMTKAEIQRKLDEIIDFAGVARYVDTPVKRYSSGMLVRLGFAVAAHLEPEILVVDEVLAVGDAEFQKKAIGKMQDVSRNEGRTVLFVSHNMASVKNLCTKTLVLNNGYNIFNGKTEEAISLYLKNEYRNGKDNLIDFITHLSEDIEIISIKINNSERRHVWMDSSQNTISLDIQGKLTSLKKMSIAVCINDNEGQRVATYDPAFINGVAKKFGKGNFIIHELISFPKHLNNGIYSLDIYLLNPGVEYIMKAEKSALLEIEGFIGGSGKTMTYKTSGFFHLEGLNSEQAIRYHGKFQQQ